MSEFSQKLHCILLLWFWVWNVITHSRKRLEYGSGHARAAPSCCLISVKGCDFTKFSCAVYGVVLDITSFQVFPIILRHNRLLLMQVQKKFWNMKYWPCHNWSAMSLLFHVTFMNFDLGRTIKSVTPPRFKKGGMARTKNKRLLSDYTPYGRGRNRNYYAIVM